MPKRRYVVRNLPRPKKGPPHGTGGDFTEVPPPLPPATAEAADLEAIAAEREFEIDFLEEAWDTRDPAPVDAGEPEVAPALEAPATPSLPVEASYAGAVADEREFEIDFLEEAWTAADPADADEPDVTPAPEGPATPAVPVEAAIETELAPEVEAAADATIQAGAEAASAPLSERTELTRGHPTPLGATRTRHGINFAVFSRHATSVTLVLFEPDQSEPAAEFALDPRFHRTGDIWHALLRGADDVEYGFRIDGPSNDDTLTSRFDPSQILVDPYARALTGAETWGRSGVSGGHAGARGRQLRSAVVADEEFDWGESQPLNVHLADSVIYELHVRGFTRHPSSDVRHPGTFKGVIEKIPYLKELGVTAVELMPVTEFEELDNPNVNPETGERLLNFWGYSPIGFFAPKASYASQPERAGQVREFRSMVKALHEAGIEVILDVVFNHTAEGDDDGTTYNFRGLDNSVYYMVDPVTGDYLDYSACGNTVNCNHPVVRDMILDCLRYWVTEMHVDGFRFDLASILGRGRDGSVLANPPLIERIAADPVLANTKLIAEAWDAAGLYQVGTFPNWGRWAEWNGPFRDDVRRLVRGDRGLIPSLATRLAGSSDLYQSSGRAPYHSINFVTSHDGLTLADLVSYDRKHNEANGENNEDGNSRTLSWNCGVEGPTRQFETLALRRRQMRNFATILLFSQGVPMILAGDEMGRSQRGNNNAWAQDNEISWIDWSLVEQNQDLVRFFRLLIEFRKRHSALRRRDFFATRSAERREVAWHGTELDKPDWSPGSHVLGMHLLGGGEGRCGDIYLIVNTDKQAHRFALPSCAGGGHWHRFVDTMLEPPLDILDDTYRPRLPEQGHYDAGARTVVVLVGK